MKTGAQSSIEETVIRAKLCTGCTACVDLCPYFKHHKDNVVVINPCDNENGRCRTYCPRIDIRPAELQHALFDAGDITTEIGPVKGIHVVRATDPEIRARAQHGGTVTALVALALDEGLIDTAILSSKEDDLQSEGVDVNDPDQVSDHAGSRFVMAPIVGRFNRISGPTSASEAEKIGVVAVPCQALALAKMRVHAAPTDRDRIDKLKLVIGLFCGWAFDWRALESLVGDATGGAAIEGLDIPPSKHACMEAYTANGTVEIPIDKVRDVVRDSCWTCFDMTAEYADVSVGSARSPDGWEVDRGWNQIIVRSETGQRLVDLARDRGVLEFKEVPEEFRDKLKRASMNKKRTCIENLVERSGSPDDLIYLDPSDPAVAAVTRTMSDRSPERG